MIKVYRLLVFSMICVVSIMSCDHSNKGSGISDNEGFEVYIRHRIGDDYQQIRNSDTIKFINYPFSVADFRKIKSANLHCVLLSKDLSRMRRLSVRPIAMMEMKEFGVTHYYVVGVPVSDGLKSISVEDYGELVTNFMGVKNIVQSWLISRCGFGCSELITWHDEQYANFFLQKRR